MPDEQTSDHVRANLHSHTDHSDGTYSPTDAVLDMMGNGVQYGTLSDHDTTSGWESFLDRHGDTVERGPGYFSIPSLPFFSSQEHQDAGLQLRVYHGIELSVFFRDHSVHIIGLGIDRPTPPVRRHLEGVMSYRYKRLRAMTDGVNELPPFKDAPIPWDGPDGVRSIAGVSESPTKIHVGEALHRAGYGSSARDCMDTYVTGLPNAAFDHTVLYSAEAGVHVLREQLRGVAGLAHPFRTAELLGLGDNLEFLVAPFAELGIQFLDANTHDEVSRLQPLAEKYNLFVLGGHDTHGDYDDKKKTGDKFVFIPRRNIERLDGLLATGKGVSSLPRLDDPHE